MTEQELLQLIYDEFHRTGAWPSVKELVVRHRKHPNLRRLIAGIGSSKIVCEDSQDGVCFLRIEALTACKGSEEDIANFLSALRLAAKRYIEQREVQITSEQIAGELALDKLSLRRLGQLLYRTGGFWGSAGQSNDGLRFTFTPREEAMFFEDVHSLEDYFAVVKRLTADASTISGVRSYGLFGEINSPKHPTSAEKNSGIPTDIALHDPGLRSVVQRDLAELRICMDAGAWKASAILAGSCVEAVLLDIWHMHEEAAVSIWGPRWPDQISLFDLANEAEKAGHISAIQKELMSSIRRSRNLIHPNVAAREDPVPYQELAGAIVAVLNLLIAELLKADVVKEGT